MSEIIEVVDKVIPAGSRPTDVTVALFEIEKLAKRLLTQWGEGSMNLHIRLELEKNIDLPAQGEDGS